MTHFNMCIGRIITDQMKHTREKKTQRTQNECMVKKAISIWQMLSLWQIIISDKRNNAWLLQTMRLWHVFNG